MDYYCVIAFGNGPIVIHILKEYKIRKINFYCRSCSQGVLFEPTIHAAYSFKIEMI